MGGLTRLFMRILPIVTLICFICFGISYTFETQQTGSLTYLSKEVITLNDNETPQDTTDDLTIEQYKFDMVSYAQNIDQDILKRATTNTINLDNYTRVIDTFNNIWEDGYQFLDGVHTIVNAIILAINSILTIVNIIITPLRIIAGLLLTGFSIIGININRQTPIITTLNTILDQATIPLLNPTYNSIYHTQLQGTTWIFNNTITMQPDDTPDIIIPIKYTDENQVGNYIKIVWNYQNTGDIYYIDIDNYWIKVYDHSSGWIYQVSKQITITDTSMTNEYDLATMVVILEHYATQIQ